MDYAPGIVTELTDEEAERAGIPPDPNWRALIDGKGHLSSAHYDKYLAKEDLDPKLLEETAGPNVNCDLAVEGHQ